ncbi:hypothetical protein EW026_g5359 [Hermanssonia centrifuga]|uniref:Uncharacterized protein n=1 Tax=Hermanssonia centrifuga TaxID=98765 RepID=A0A4S4KFC6_9APHY|nr:hypothetical protein EW026_g5359 [Hermanssonia centrifuga]
MSQDSSDATSGLVSYVEAGCEGVTRSGQVLALAQYVVFGLFSALRVYALWDRNVLLFLLILGLNMVPVATNIYNFKTITVTLYTVFPALGAACIEISISLATRLAVVLADILVLVLTWMKTFGTRREASRIHIEVPMVTLLIRDGTIYFIALLAMNVAQILIQNISIFQLFSPVSQFITV